MIKKPRNKVLVKLNEFESIPLLFDVLNWTSELKSITQFIDVFDWMKDFSSFRPLF